MSNHLNLRASRQDRLKCILGTELFEKKKLKLYDIIHIYTDIGLRAAIITIYIF